MFVKDLIKVLPENEAVVFDYDNNYLLFKIIRKHYQVARCLVTINDGQNDYLKFLPFYRRIFDEIENIQVSTDSDGHIPYMLVKIRTI